ncbi:MAG: amidohydrolase family protein [Anaerolineae bacterium]
MIIDFRIRIPPRRQFPQGEAAMAEMPGFVQRYQALYKEALQTNWGDEDLLAAMEAAGITRGVLQAEFEFGDYRALNWAVQEMAQRYPDHFIGYCTVDPAADDDMVAVVSEAVEEHGMRGVNLQPWAYRVKANDRRFYPLYARCAELGLPVTVHTGVNFSTDRSIDFGRPLYLDQVACDFPELVLVANHGGWPWVAEMMAVAWKHPQVYVEIGGIAPKYLALPGSGWETLMQFANSVLQDQVLFATDWPLIPFDRAVCEFNQLPLKESVKEKILYKNAARLLGLNEGRG